MSIEAMKQALEALERIDLWLKARYNGIGLVGVELEAITSLRQAIAEAEKQEPVAWADHGVVNWIADAQFKHAAYLYTHPQPKAEQTSCYCPNCEALSKKLAEQEPVAWMRTSGTGSPVVTEELLVEMPEMRWNFQTALYTHPQPKREWVDLTDEDELDWEEGGNLKDLVKAIEAKLKEKNGI